MITPLKAFLFPALGPGGGLLSFEVRPLVIVCVAGRGGKELGMDEDEEGG